MAFGYLLTGGHYGENWGALHQRLLQEVLAGCRILQAPQDNLEQVSVPLWTAGARLAAENLWGLLCSVATLLAVLLQVLERQAQVVPQGGTEPSYQRPHLEEGQYEMI